MRARTTGSGPATSSRIGTRPSFLLGALLSLAAIACGGDSPAELADDELQDPCRSSTDISMGQSATGQLTTTDCAPLNGPYGDRWSFNLSARLSVRIDLSSNDFDPFLELRDDRGTIIAQNDDVGGLNSRIIQTLQAGSYVVVARSLSAGEVGSYQLSVREAPDCSPVGVLQLGQSASGSLAATDCLFDFGGVMDNWSLSLTSAQKLRLDLKSTTFDEILLVRDQQGNVVNGADWNGPTGFARLETVLEAGSWTISVTALNESARGAYELTVDVAPPCTPGTDFVLGETVEGEITSSDCLVDYWMPADSFGLQISEETPISILLKSADFDPLVILRDHTGWDVAVGWSEMGNGSARITATLEPDSYSLFATGNGYPSASGSYQLTVTEVVCADAGAIEFGQTVHGTLTVADCQRAGGAYKQSWKLVLTSDVTARIDLESDAFDAYLELRDAAGDVIEVDDDGGEGVDSRIDRMLTAGTYKIVASSYGGGQTGAYTLTVDAPPPALAGVVSPANAQQLASKVAPAPQGGADLLDRIRREREAARTETQPWLHGDPPKGRRF